MSKRRAQTIQSKLTFASEEDGLYHPRARSTSLLFDEDAERRSFFSPFRDEDEAFEKPKDFFARFSIMTYFQAGTVPQAILSLVAATIGTGILMVSNALAPSGAIFSTVQMVFAAWMSAYTLIALVTCANDLGATSYQEVAFRIFGSKFRHVVNFTCFFANWGSAILFLQLSVQLFAVVADFYGGDTLPSWLTDPTSKILIALQATVFVLPLCIQKELKALRYFTFINLCLILLFCYAVIYEGMDYYQPLSTSFSKVTMFQFSGFSTTFPSAVFMMTSHTNVIDIFIEMKNPTIKKMKTVITWTIIFSLIVCLTVGLIGYATFAQDLSILSDSSDANGLIVVAYGYNLGFEGGPSEGTRPYPILVIINMITMCASIIISQPFNIKPAKDSCKDSFDCFFLKMGWKKEEDLGEDNEKFWERFIYASVTLYTVVLVVLFSDSAQLVMNIVGGGFFSLLCFVFPSMFYLKLHGETLTLSTKIINWAIVIFNTIFAIWSTAENVIQSF